MKYLIFIALILFCLTGTAQNINTDTISWNASSTTSIIDGSNVTESTQFTTYGHAKAEWRDASGVLRNSFVVTEVLGSWSNIATVGGIIYEVTSQGNFGNITFSKSGQDTKIRIFLLVNSDPVVYELKISTFQQ